jgi:hypothetical protein
MDLRFSDELKSRSEFKEGNFLNFYKRIPADRHPNLRQRIADCASLFGSIYIYEKTFSLMK